VVQGFNVLEWLRNDPRLKGIPVVVFTSSPREEDQVEARRLGANDYIDKPNSGRLFAGVVEQPHPLHSLSKRTASSMSRVNARPYPPVPANIF
jgi:CheY-like chemotaxis protein